MNQKEAKAAGLIYSDGQAQRVLRRIRLHVLWCSDVPLEERRRLDQALVLLEPLAWAGQARWDQRCAESNERNRVRLEAYRAKQEAAHEH